MDWLDLLAIQGFSKSLLQDHSSKASILWHSAFFVVQLSHPYMTTGKTIVLTVQTFIGKVMSLLFNKLSRFVIAFLPRRKHLLISWLQPLFAVILEAKKILPFCLPWSDEIGCYVALFCEWVKSLSHVQLSATPWTVAHQAPLSMGFSRQEYWSGLPFPSPGDLPDPGIEPRSPAFQADALPSEPPGSSTLCLILNT